MKKLLLTLLSFMVTFAVNAERVSKKEALQKAQQFMPGRHFVESKSVASARAQTSGKADAFYVFNAEDNGGYVIVSGDDRTREILSYADKGNLDMNKIPENMKWWLDNIASQIEALGTTLKPADKSATRSGMTAIAPLIQTEWGQGSPYNNMCPDGNYVDYYEEGFDTDYNNRCCTGCVATAMAQLMYYWKWPKTCPALDEYNFDPYYNGNLVRIKALPATTFKYDIMTHTYRYKQNDEAADAVAELMRYCGQSVKADYHVALTSASLLHHIMSGVFKYSKNHHDESPDGYTASEWESLIYAELSLGHPVPYQGRAVNWKGGGNHHMFIIDGYDGNGLFHFNWGCGDSGSYGVLSVADPYEEHAVGGSTNPSAYQYEQYATIGLKPAEDGEIYLPIISTASSKFVSKCYTRNSVTDCFNDVELTGRVEAFYYLDPESEHNMQIGWGLFQNEKVISVFASKDVKIPLEKITTFDNNQIVSFGAGLSDGKYDLYQLYRFSDNEDWKKCGTSRSILVADVKSTTLTIRKPDTESFAVNSIKTSEQPEVEHTLNVVVNVTNTSESDIVAFNLWIQREGAGSWEKVSIGDSYYINPGQSADLLFNYIPKEIGNYTLKVTGKADEILKTAKVNIPSSEEIVVDNVKYFCTPVYQRATVVANENADKSVSYVAIKETVNVNGVECKVRAIDDFAFYRWENLTTIDIPEGIESTGEYAIGVCHNIKKIVLPSTLSNIAQKAFYYNSGVDIIVSHIVNPCSIPNRVFTNETWDEMKGGLVYPPSRATLYVPYGTKSMYEAAGWTTQFANVEEGEPIEAKVGVLKYMYTKEGNSATVIWDDTYKGLTEVVIPAIVTIGDKKYKVKTIGKDAFAGCWKMKSVTLPVGLAVIGSRAFIGSGLETVVIPECVETIGEKAYSNCFNLKKIVLPSTLTSIADNAFYCNTSVEAVISHIVNPCTIPDRVFRLEYWDDLNGEYSYPPSPATLYVPLGTKSLYEAAGWTDQFTKVEEGETLETRVGVLKYSYSTGGSEAIVIQDESYKDLTDVIVPATVQIGNKAYKVVAIGKNAFQNCYDLKTVTLSDGLKSIGENAFWGCQRLKSLVVPEGVESIGNNAFSYMGSLTSIELPESLKRLGSYLIEGDEELMAVVSHIIEPFAIDDNTFAVLKWNSDTQQFESTPSSATIYVPVGSADKYRKTKGWGWFQAIVEGIPNIVGDVNNDGLVDGKDIDAIIRYILEGDYEGFIFENADVNADEKINAADIVEVVKIIKANK